MSGLSFARRTEAADRTGAASGEAILRAFACGAGRGSLADTTPAEKPRLDIKVMAQGAYANGSTTPPGASNNNAADLTAEVEEDMSEEDGFEDDYDSSKTSLFSANMFDGAKTLDEFIEKARHKLAHVTKLKAEGWEMSRPISWRHDFEEMRHEGRYQELLVQRQQRVQQGSNSSKSLPMDVLEVAESISEPPTTGAPGTAAVPAVKPTEQPTEQPTVSRDTKGEELNYWVNDLEEGGNEDEWFEYYSQAEDGLRVKWLFEGVQTLDMVIECLRWSIEHFTDLKAEGWELIAPVHDDYGIIRNRRKWLELYEARQRQREKPAKQSGTV